MDNIIYSYTRAQAIEDGVLADVTEVASRLGFKFPVAITERIFNKCMRHGTAHFMPNCLNILTSLKSAISKLTDKNDIVYFSVKLDDADAPIELWSVCGPGDTAEPVITIMFTDED